MGLSLYQVRKQGGSVSLPDVGTGSIPVSTKQRDRKGKSGGKQAEPQSLPGEETGMVPVSKK